jgi:hypothetical protein
VYFWILVFPERGLGSFRSGSRPGRFRWRLSLARGFARAGLRLALLGTRDAPLFCAPRPGASGTDGVCPSWYLVVRGDGGFRYCLDDGARFPGLRNGQGPGPLGEERACDAREDEASQNRHGQDIVGNLLVAHALGGKAKDDVLDLVVYPATCLEGLGLGVRREVVEVGLEEPEGLGKGMELAAAINGADVWEGGGEPGAQR